MNICLSAQRLCRIWDSVAVDVSFTAERGSMTVIVGQSGGGKSTVLRLIAGLEQFSPRRELHLDRPDEPEPQVILDGQDITHTPPGKRNIGMVFQNHALFSHMDAAGNVAYGLLCRGMGRREARSKAESYLEAFGLAGFGNRMPATLSGGEAQRVSLARTLIVKPSLVLFDEPLSALDAPLRKRLAADIRSAQKREHFTGIFVTHDIAEAKAVADRILLMEHGTIKWEGTPANFSESLMCSSGVAQENTL